MLFNLHTENMERFRNLKTLKEVIEQRKEFRTQRKLKERKLNLRICNVNYIFAFFEEISLIIEVFSTLESSNHNDFEIMVFILK